MVVNNTIFRPTKGFNQSFKEIVNCEIVPPPYNDKMQDMFFFLRKRDWVLANYQNASYYFLDMALYEDTIWWVEEYHTLLKESGTGRDFVYVPWTWVVWWLLETFDSLVSEHYNVCKIPWGNIDSTWTISATGVVVQAVNWEPINTLYIEKTAWVFNNSMVGKWIYLENWGVGQWRYWEIVFVNAWLWRIYIEWIPLVPDVWLDFTIYDWLVKWLFVWDFIGVHCYFWPASGWKLLSSTSLWTSIAKWVKDTTVWKKKLWYTDWDRVYYSYDARYTSFGVTRYIEISDPWIMKLYPFGDYLLVFTDNKTYGIREQNLESWDKLYFVDELMTNLTLFSKWSILFDKTLYFFWNDKRFYSLNIIRSWNSDNIWEPIDQWMAIQNYLSSIALSTNVRIFKDTDTLRILFSSWDYELVYNYKWEWRTLNNYSVNCKINNKVNIRQKEWILGSGFVGNYSVGETQDIWAWFHQRVYHILDTDDIFQLKQRKHYKFLIGKYNLPQTAELTLTRQVNNLKKVKTADLIDCRYVQELTTAIGAWTLDTMADVGLWTVAVDSWWVLTEIELEDYDNGFMYGWVLAQKNTMNPKTNNIYNVN